MEYEEVPGDDDEEEAGFPKHRAGDDQESTGMLEMNAAEYSVEGLRREVRKGADGIRSDYESGFCICPYLFVSLGGETLVSSRDKEMRMLTSGSPEKSMIINKAVQDIGMGRYNWQLFVLCGFGWFADKYVEFPR
jgi:hypothetical protein